MNSGQLNVRTDFLQLIDKSIFTDSTDRIVFLKNSYIEALTANTTVFGDRVCKQVINVK
jgi:hypothetical protein